MSCAIRVYSYEAIVILGDAVGSSGAELGWAFGEVERLRVNLEGV